MNNNKNNDKPFIVLSIWLLTVIIAILLSGCSHTPYVKVGAGYKIHEEEMVWRNGDKSQTGNHPISARLEAGFEYGEITYGVSHHSQYFSGAPFNNEEEYDKTEVFIDYTIRFK